MIIKNEPKRYKVSFVIDTHLSKKQILGLLNWMEACMIDIEDKTDECD